MRSSDRKQPAKASRGKAGLSNAPAAKSPAIDIGSGGVPLDRTPPTIDVLFPSDESIHREGALRVIQVEARDDPDSESAVKCSASLDGRALAQGARSGARFTFIVPADVAPGPHKILVKAVDAVGNKASTTCAITIEARDRVLEGEQWRREAEERKAHVRTNAAFQKRVLTRANAALREMEIPYAGRIAATLPGPLPDDFAEYLLNTDQVAASRVLARLGDAIASRPVNDPAVVGIRDLIAVAGTTPDAEAITRGTRAVISTILRDPRSILESFGVELTADEQALLPPALPPLEADAFAEWMVGLNNPAGSPPHPPTVTSTIETPSPSEATAPLRSSDPVTAYRELFPDADSRALLRLRSIPVGNAGTVSSGAFGRAPVTPRSEATLSSTSTSGYDAIVGLSIWQLQTAIDFYFARLNPGLLPMDVTFDIPVALPQPMDVVHAHVTVGTPEGLHIVDVATGKLSAVVNATAVLTVDSGGPVTCSLTIEPVYSLTSVLSHVALGLVSVNVDVSVSGAEPFDETIAGMIEERVRSEIQARYPTGEVRLFDLPLVTSPLEIADTEVMLERITVFDDTDPLGSGELYFGIGLNGDEHLFGQIDAAALTGLAGENLTSSVVEINQRILMKLGASGLEISIRGVDVDGFPHDDNDFLGAGRNTIAPGSITAKRTTFGVMINRDAAYLETVWDLVETIVLWVVEVVCWLVQVIVKFISWLLSFFDIHWEWRCRDNLVPKVKQVFGWIRHVFTHQIASYQLEYSVRRITPPTITTSLVALVLEGDGLYCGLKVDIPDVPDSKQKTEAREFLGAAHAGMALSENLVQKLVAAYWAFGAAPAMLASSLDDLSTYFTARLDPPRISFEEVMKNGRLQGMIGLHLASRGELGVNESGFHLSYAIPPRIEGLVSAVREPAGLVLQVVDAWVPPYFLEIIPFSRWETDLLRKALEKTGKPRHVAKLPEVMFSVAGNGFELAPKGPLLVKDRELIQCFTMDTAPHVSAPAYVGFGAPPEHKGRVMVTISNAGNSTLEVSAIEFSDPQYRLASNVRLPLSIRLRSTRDVEVEFVPTSVGTSAATMTIRSNDTANPAASVTLSAVASAYFVPSPAVLDVLPSVYWGSVVPANLTLTNNGNAPGVISEVTTNSARVVPVGDIATPLSVPVGGQVSFAFRYDETAIGSYTGLAVTLRVATGVQSTLTVPVALGDVLAIHNANEISTETHLPGCRYAQRILPEHVRVVFVSEQPNWQSRSRSSLLTTITAEPWDGCYYCLRRWHRR